LLNRERLAENVRFPIRDGMDWLSNALDLDGVELLPLTPDIAVPRPTLRIS